MIQFLKKVQGKGVFLFSQSCMQHYICTVQYSTLVCVPLWNDVKSSSSLVASQHTPSELMHQKAFSLSLTRHGIPILSISLRIHTTMRVQSITKNRIAIHVAFLL